MTNVEIKIIKKLDVYIDNYETLLTMEKQIYKRTKLLSCLPNIKKYQEIVDLLEDIHYSTMKIMMHEEEEEEEDEC